MFGINRRSKYEHRFYDMVSYYKMVCFLHQAIISNDDSSVVNDTKDNLCRYFGISLKTLLVDMHNLIEYTYFDMAHYFYSQRGNCRVPDWVTENRMEHYLGAMAEQVSLLKWKTGAFYHKVSYPGKITILDIGCGLMPFKSIFKEANKKVPLFDYVGIDKSPIPETTQWTVTTTNIEQILDIYFPDVVFFGNSLHCFSAFKSILTTILNPKYRVKGVMIVDYDPDSNQGLTLAYHLSQHTHDWSEPSVYALRELAKIGNRKFTITKVSLQHVMYKFGPAR